MSFHCRSLIRFPRTNHLSFVITVSSGEANDNFNQSCEQAQGLEGLQVLAATLRDLIS